MRRILTAIFLLWAAAAAGQILDHTKYIYPIKDVSGLCSSNFGEIRTGHFHAGVDIKTGGVEGKSLVAIADGYISRVVLIAGGYGRAVYLTMADGKTAVYGHMQRFRDDLEDHVQKYRRDKCSNDADLWFDAGRYPVRQGDLIGYSGNSGSSGGPHLHFELRDDASQMRYNIVKEGLIRPTDNIPPRIINIYYVAVDTLRSVAVGSPERYGVVHDAAKGYRMTRTSPLPVGRKGYFVAEVTDRRNNVTNRFGIWRISAAIDGEPYFEYRMDGFTYDEARTCDAVSHYALQLASSNECIRLARAETVPGRFYTTATDRGLVRTAIGQQRSISLEVEDDSGNISTLKFDIVGEEREPATEPDSSAVVLRHDRAGSLRIGDTATAWIPEGALYEPAFFTPRVSDSNIAMPKGVVALSRSCHFIPATMPLRQSVVVTLRGDIPVEYRLRALAGRVTATQNLVSAGGTYSDGAIKVTTGSVSFCVSELSLQTS